MKITDVSNSRYIACQKRSCKEVFKIEIPMYKEFINTKHICCPFCGHNGVEYATVEQMRKFDEWL